MASEVLERVARAIAKAAVTDMTDQERNFLTVDRVVDERWIEWAEDARAAIGAMRDPTEGMIVAASHVLADNANMIAEEDYELVSMMTGAMIDVALSE
jgi:hydrogenase maturation factor